MNALAASLKTLQPALALSAVSKVFEGRPHLRIPWQPRVARRRVIAVDDVSLSVTRGEIFGILGANGSGKSTLIRVISTLLLPDHGSVQVFGLDVVHDELKVKQLINRVSVDAAFFKKLSPMENLIYAGRLYGLGADNEDLPGFITISPPPNNGGSVNFGSSFLPPVYQGTKIDRFDVEVEKARLPKRRRLAGQLRRLDSRTCRAKAGRGRGRRRFGSRAAATAADQS